MQRKYLMVVAALALATSAANAQTMGSKDKGPTVAQPTQTPLGAPPERGTGTSTGSTVSAPTAGERGTAVGSGLAGSAATNGDDPYYTHAWNAMDANGDGRVSRDEYLKYYGTRYDEFDTTRRGYLGRDEMRRLYLEREMSKTDGHPRGTPLNPTTKK